MIDIPRAEIVTKIKEAKGLSEDEINAKIQEKLTQLAGLISEDGAAHIIANELGVHPVTAQILARRNMHDADAARRFLRPSAKRGGQVRSRVAAPCDGTGCDRSCPGSICPVSPD